MSEKPVVDRNKCDGCGLCVEVCHCNILIVVNNIATIVEQEKCPSCNRWCCAQCEMVCPTGAITVPFEVVIEGC